MRAKFFFISLPVLICLVVFTTEFKTDVSAFFIAGDNVEEILLASEIQSGSLSRRYILSVAAPENRTVSKQFINEFSSLLKEVSGISDVWRPGEKRGAVKVLKSLYIPHSAQLYSRNPETYIQETLTEVGLNEKAKALKQALLSPQAGLVKKIAKKDPLLLTLNGFKSIADQAQTVINADSQYQNLIIETIPSGMDVNAQLAIQQKIKSAFTQLQATEVENYQLEMTGVPVFAAATQSRIEQDIKSISILSSIALSILFFWIFRSFKVLFLVATILVAVIATAVLVTQVVFGSVHGLTLAIGSTLVGICIDYPIHTIIHTQTVDVSQRYAVTAKIWPSMLMGAVTTLIGYFALGVSGYPGFQQVAVYAGTGIVVALLLTRYILPGLITGDKQQARNQNAFSTRWLKLCHRYRSVMLLVLLVISLFSLWTMNSLTWMQDLQELTPELNELKAKDKAIRSRMVSLEPGRFILVSAENTEQVLQKAEQVYNILDQYKEQGYLTDYFGLYPWILSQKQQLLNKQKLAENLTEQKLKWWNHALQAQGLSVEHLGSLSYPETNPLTLTQVLDSAVGRLIKNQLVMGEERILLIIWLAKHQPEELRNAFENMDHVQYFSQRDLLNRMSADYQQRAELMLMGGLALIALLLWIRYKSLWKMIQTLAPSLLSAVMILALWSLADVAISFLHLVGFLLAVAICVDYGIFFQENRSGNIALTYQAMGASMLSSALAFGSLAVADTATLKVLAHVVTSGVVLGFLFCPVIIKKAIKEK